MKNQIGGKLVAYLIYGGVLGAVLLAGCERETVGDKFPLTDLSGDQRGEVVIAAGTEDIYQGHPTMVTTAD